MTTNDNRPKPTPEQIAKAKAIVAEQHEAGELTARIAAQNDAFRQSGPIPSNYGKWVVTSSVHDMGPVFVALCLEAVGSFTAFTEDCDPYATHEMGGFEIQARKVWWKIDLYDADYAFGSPEPANPEVTRRVLTVLFPEDY